MSIQKWDLIPFVRGVGVYIGPERPFVHMMRLGSGQLNIVAQRSLDFICLSEGLSWQLVLDAWSKLKLGGRLIVWHTIEEGINVPDALKNECWDWTWHDEDATHFLQVFVRESRDDESQRELVPSRPERCAAVVRPGGQNVGYGDALWASSVIAQLHGAGYHVTVYTDAAGEDALRHDPHVGRFIVDAYSMIGREDIAKYWEHEAGRYDRWVNLTHAVESELLIDPTQMASLWPTQARHARCNENYLAALHSVAGLPYVPRQRFYPTAEEKAAAHSECAAGYASVIVLVDTGSTETKWWPYMADLANNLVDACDDLLIIVLGTVKTIFPEHPRIRVLGTERSWRVAASIAMEADIVIGQETGLLNAVAFEENHKIVLLTHSTVENLTRDWVNTTSLAAEHLRCYPCHILHFNGFDRCVRDAERGSALCQSEIPVTRVFDVAMKALSLDAVPA